MSCERATVQQRQEATYLCTDCLTGLDTAAKVLHRQSLAQIGYFTSAW